MFTTATAPAEWGLPESFDSWRPVQQDALEFIDRSPKRIKALCAPTGSGKSLIGMGDALRHPQEPTCYVTDSRALQDQLLQQFGGMGLVDLRGRSNYECGLRDDYTCENGYAARCPHKGTFQCPASAAEMRAAASPLVSTNYAKWIHARKYGQGLSHIKRVVFDEGHCFPEGTLVEGKPIEQIELGDDLSTGQVTAIGRRVVTAIVHLRFDDGTSIVSSLDHPFLTSKGWQQAVHLSIGSECYKYDANCIDMRTVQGPLFGAGAKSSYGETILHEILRQLVSDDPLQSDAESRITKQDAGDNAAHIAWPPSSRGQRAGSDCGAVSTCVQAAVGDGDCHWRSAVDERLPEKLQAGHRASSDEDRNRGRRAEPRTTEPSGSGSEERGIPRLTRLVYSQIHQSRDSGEFEQLCPEGRVYNLTVSGTNIYLAEGLVVHNCMYEALGKAMQVVLHAHEINDVLKLDFPDPHDAAFFEIWKVWAAGARVKCEEMALAARSRLLTSHDPKSQWVKHYTHLQQLSRRLAILSTANPHNWVVEEQPRAYQFDPIQPGRYVESALLLGVPDIVVMSATLTLKTLFMVGIGQTQFDFKEFPSDFPADRCPVYHVPTMRVDAKAHDFSPLWIRLDQVAAKRQDRNGIVHTVSFARRDQVLASSRFASRMFVNERGEPATEMVEAFIAAYPGAILVSPSVGQGFDFAQCVTPDTLILTDDLRYIPAGDAAVGQGLAAIDEEPPVGQRARSWRHGVVTHNHSAMKDCVRIVLMDGTDLICSNDHPWLCTTGQRAAYWRRSDRLKAYHHRLIKVADVWSMGTDRDAGYLAGIWDGEGHLSQRINVWRKTGADMPHMSLGMSQVQGGIVLDETIRALTNLSYPYRAHHSDRSKIPNHQNVTQLHISTVRASMRFLGSIRPQRLLNKLNIDLLGSIRPGEFVPVVRVEPVGRREIASLTTSTKTFIAAGYVAHNTKAEWQFIAKLPFPSPSKVLQARTDVDPEHPHHLTMQKLVQSVGRVMRDKSDRGETIIPDNHLQWFLPRYRHLAPKSFFHSVRQVSVVPPPPDRLAV